MTAQLDSLVGENFIPAYPAYVLAVLQATEAGTEIDVNASTHGYLYELFIKSAIAKRTTALGFNVISSYLAHLAHWMYANQRKDASCQELRFLHEDLQARFEVLPEVEPLVAELDQMQLIRNRPDLIRFRHKYIYYYFLAAYFRDTLQTVETRNEIGLICSRLYEEDEANVILFLSHLSKDHFVVDSLLKVANSQCPKSPLSDLNQDVDFLNVINSDVSKVRLEVLSHREHREQQLEQMDDATYRNTLVGQDDLQEEWKDGTSYLCQINVALKTIQI